ncbi:MAG: hypothetical protein ACJ788_11525, partial [Ktedonobacteraceae bacterium]
GCTGGTHFGEGAPPGTPGMEGDVIHVFSYDAKITEKAQKRQASHKYITKALYGHKVLIVITLHLEYGCDLYKAQLTLLCAECDVTAL